MKYRCSRCSGSGYVKQNSEVCDSCNGKKCIYCNSTGLKKLPYETCYSCFGAGEIEDNIVNKDWTVNCSGAYTLGDRNFHCWNYRRYVDQEYIH